MSRTAIAALVRPADVSSWHEPETSSDVRLESAFRGKAEDMGSRRVFRLLTHSGRGSLPGIATLLTIRQRLLQIMTMTGVPVSHGLRSNPLNLSG
jgi:hypothetical protein